MSEPGLIFRRVQWFAWAPPNKLQLEAKSHYRHIGGPETRVLGVAGCVYLCRVANKQ